MSEETSTEQIERYLLGKMNEAEQLSFEQRLRTDSALRQEMDLQQKIQQHVRQVGRGDLHKRLKAIHHTMEGQTDSDKTAIADQGGKVVSLRPRFVFWQYAMAASVVLVLGLSLYGLLPTKSAGGEQPQLAFIPYAPTGAPRSFGMANAEADSTLPVLIYPATRQKVNSYRFDDTLRLYGQFDPSQLRLVYRPGPKMFVLEMQEETYLLQRFVPELPLAKAADETK